MSIDSTDDQPEWQRYEERVASFSRLIRYDARGIGLSDPIDPHAPQTVEQQVEDAVAVLDAAGAEQAHVVATTVGSYPAIALAATHPDRVRGLVLIHAFARVLWAEDYPWGYPLDLWDRVMDEYYEPGQEVLDEMALVAASRIHDEHFRTWFVRAGRRGASPATARARFIAMGQTDVRAMLPVIRVPTLVLHRGDNPFVPVASARHLADNIPDARLVVLDGSDHIPWLLGQDALLDEIEQHVTGAPSTPTMDRVLATVLFTDIVDSTRRAAELGDVAWRRVLEQHDDRVRAAVARERGTTVKTTGDGVLALFDGPGRAIRCAEAIRAAARSLGLEVRAGLHTGEVELRAGDVAGIAVHIAARVLALADAGDVLVSASIPPLVIGSGIPFTPRGEHELKGVPGRWPVFRVDPPS